jgi:hypothetical protein
MLLLARSVPHRKNHHRAAAMRPGTRESCAELGIISGAGRRELLLLWVRPPTASSKWLPIDRMYFLVRQMRYIDLNTALPKGHPNAREYHHLPCIRRDGLRTLSRTLEERTCHATAGFRGVPGGWTVVGRWNRNRKSGRGHGNALALAPHRRNRRCGTVYPIRALLSFEVGEAARLPFCPGAFSGAAAQLVLNFILLAAVAGADKVPPALMSQSFRSTFALASRMR